MSIKAIEARIARAHPELVPTLQPSEPFINVVYQWDAAADSKVCLEICAPRDGLQWERNDYQSIPEIPAHPNCRCQLKLVEIPSTQPLMASSEAIEDLLVMTELVESIK